MATSLEQLNDPNKNSEEDQALVHSILQEMKQQDNQQQQQPAQPSQYEPQYQQQQQPQQQQQQYYEDDYQMMPAGPPASLLSKIIAESKQPLLIAALFTAFSLPVLDKILSQYIPRISNDYGGVNLFGIAFKAIIVALLYYLLKHLLKLH